MSEDCFKTLVIFLLYVQISLNFADQSTVILQNDPSAFQPANPVEFLQKIKNVHSIMQCYTQCNFNVQCRTFVYKSGAQECSLYEGSIDSGSVVTAANELSSIVGGLVYTPELFISYGQTCDQCASSRYLHCLNNTCQCMAHTFWNGTMCLNQVYYGDRCVTDLWCRTADLSLTCLSDCGVCAGKCCRRSHNG